jgi:hypothetical protein
MQVDFGPLGKLPENGRFQGIALELLAGEGISLQMASNCSFAPIGPNNFRTFA